MILSSVIIVLGEVLEAAILTSLFMVLTHHLLPAKKWLFISLFTGFALATGYAVFFDQISQQFDGFGQELTNASTLIALYCFLLIFNNLVITSRHPNPSRKLLCRIMVLAVSLAIMREGSEIYIYLYGYYFSDNGILPVLTGSLLGAGIGVSVGVLIYYFLLNLPKRMTALIGYFILTLSAAGMLIQAVRLLIQIDYLPSSHPVWDTSAFLSESSVTGRLLYTLIGYESTPTQIEVIFYLGALATMFLSSYLVNRYFGRSSQHES